MAKMMAELAATGVDVCRPTVEERVTKKWRENVLVGTSHTSTAVPIISCEDWHTDTGRPTTLTLEP